MLVFLLLVVLFSSFVRSLFWMPYGMFFYRPFGFGRYYHPFGYGPMRHHRPMGGPRRF